MVLTELGSRISDALSKLVNRTVVDQKALDDLVDDIVRALMESDVNIMLISRLRNNIRSNINLEEIAAGVNARRMIQQSVFEELCKLLNPGKEPFRPRRGRSNVIMFVGLQGSGKTTTCAKFARWYQKKGFKTAMVCADTFRAGAFDQLKQNAIRAQVDFYGSYSETNPVVIARDGVDKFREEKYDIIIVDTSGRHKQQESLFEEMEQVSQAVTPDEHIFVMDASIGQAAEDQAKAFKERVPVGSVIITKLDGHASGGGALSAVAATNSPIVFIGTGEGLGSLEPFDAKRFVKRLLGFGDVEGLIEKLQQEVTLENPEELMANMSKGKFTVRNMREFLEQSLKMGSFTEMASMIPGMNDMLKAASSSGQKLTDEMQKNKLRSFLTMIDSMNNKELDSDQISKLLNEPRLIRIARGSGCRLEEVREMVTLFKTMQRTFGNKNIGKALSSGRPPDRATMQKMASMLPGGGAGMGGMQGMLQNLMGKGGLGGLSGLGSLGNLLGGGGKR